MLHMLLMLSDLFMLALRTCLMSYRRQILLINPVALKWTFMKPAPYLPTKFLIYGVLDLFRKT